MPDFRSLSPSVSVVLATPRARSLESRYSRAVVIMWIRSAVADRKNELQNGMSPQSRDEELQCVLQKVESLAKASASRRLTPVINATGIILHTGLGRAPLSEEAAAAVAACAGTCGLELDLISGERGQRGEQLTGLWQALTNCEASLTLNNNAAATLLTLQALCTEREVIISRGQLVEVGGSFRLPDVFSLSGAVLREVGTTNRTRMDDYRAAIGPRTAAILRVHPSNYRIEGFTETPDIREICELGREAGLPVIDDIGSGCLIDTTQYSLPSEPTFRESIEAGADLVLGSGDKLLGGPQAGIVLGKGELIQRLRRHPLYRALRIDKLTLAALQATLELYLHQQTDRLPIVEMMSQTAASLRLRAQQIAARLSSAAGVTISMRDDHSAIGGGSLPGADLPTVVLQISVDSQSAVETAYRLRTGSIPVVTRIHNQFVVVDLRSVLSRNDEQLVQALQALFRAAQGGGD